MGLFDRLRSALSEPERLAAKLAVIAGRYEVLVKRLQRHADMCIYAAIAQGVRALAAREAAHERTLRAILANRGRWPKPPAFTPREGANNWERLSGDLAMLLALSQELRRQALDWENVDPALAASLVQLEIGMAENESELRKLALKCDPQAID